jgi:hypothetical protein
MSIAVTRPVSPSPAQCELTRLASEPEASFVAKGGDLAETVGRRCLCNSLMATVGHAQVRANGTLEPPPVAGGDDLKHLADFLGARTHYSAGDVIDWLLSAKG